MQNKVSSIFTGLGLDQYRRYDPKVRYSLFKSYYSQLVIENLCVQFHTSKTKIFTLEPFNYDFKGFVVDRTRSHKNFI